MLAIRFLRPVTAPLISASAYSTATATATSTSLGARIPCFRKFDYPHRWMNLKSIKSQELCAVPKSSYKFFYLRRFCRYAMKLRSSGRRFTAGTMAGFAALGSLSLWPQPTYCAYGSNILSDYVRSISSDASISEENLRRAIHLLQRLLVPLFLIVTVWLNWGQSHPVFLAAKVALIFLSTKPIPSSIYIFVDQLRSQMMSRQPFLYRFKPLQVKTVYVEDYIFLCFARVEIKDERLALVGMLGCWWILPLSSWKEVFIFDKLSWKELASLVKSRFRLDADMSSY